MFRRDLLKCFGLGAASLGLGSWSLASEPGCELEPTPTQREALATLCPGEHIWVGGNRSGVTTAGALAVRQAIDRGMKNIWCVGYDQRTIGDSLYRILFTREFSNNGKLCEPIIPRRLIDSRSWEWENKASRVVRSVQMKNGSKLRFWSSKLLDERIVRKTDPIDFVWIDCAPHDLMLWDDIAEHHAPHVTQLLTSWPSVDLQDIWDRRGVHHCWFRTQDNTKLSEESRRPFMESIRPEA